MLGKIQDIEIDCARLESDVETMKQQIARKLLEEEKEKDKGKKAHEEDVEILI